MADSQDRALGTLIRRRRSDMGLRQQEMAERLGMTPVVYGRIELGSRSVRATEIRDIARILGVTADDLLREVSPVTAREQVERAVARRDVAYAALLDYAVSVADAISAAAGEEDGAVLEGDVQVSDAREVVEYLDRSRPMFDGLTVGADLIAPLRESLSVLAAAVPLYAARRSADDGGDDV